MTKQAAHEQLAESNRELSVSLASSGEYRWAIVTAFYAAVHYACALLARDGIRTEQFEDHAGREYQIGMRHPGISSDYGSLKAQSIAARYLPQATTDSAAYRRARKRLGRIEDYWRRVTSDAVPGR